MQAIKRLMERILGRYYKNFKKYSWVSLTFAFYEVFLLWVFIDKLGKNTLISTILIVGSSTIFKFYFYVYSNMMKNNFLGYMFVLIIFYFINVAGIWFLVEVLGFLASFSSILLAILLFHMRFLAFGKFNLLRE